MSWLATSPHGPQRNASWHCAAGCKPPAGTPHNADPDITRAAAIAHVEQTGHIVSYARGTIEILHPMATTVPEGDPS